jgi:hypothetical protein
MMETDRGGAVALAFTALMLLGAGACERGNLLEVSTPDLVTPDDIQGPRGAELFAAGALGQFQEVFDDQVLAAGLLTDEFHYAGVWPPSVSLDRREWGERAWGAGYGALHRARVGLENAAEIVEEFLPGDPRIAQMYALAGFTYVLFAEHFCSGVPFGRTTPSGDAIHGVQQSTEETYGTALDRFASATAAAAGSTDMEHLAAVGAARALLDLGQYAEAADRISGVPTDWAYLARYKAGGAGSQENNVYVRSHAGRDYSLSDLEGSNGLPYRSPTDPRVPWTSDGGFGSDGETLYFELTKYASEEDDIVVADGVEARLIEAEAALQTGDAGLMLTKLNELRATLTLGDLTDPGTLDGRVDLLFSERARWMFATAHRLGDMRRLVRQYGRDPETVYPTGLHHLAGTYGTDVDIGIPPQEEANPNYAGCFNRGA